MTLPHCCHSKSTCNTHAHTYCNTFSHTHIHSLKWRVWNWAGTWNEYSKQLSFSLASSNPFPMNIFTSAYFSFPALPPSLLLLLLCCTFSPPSFLLPHRWRCLSPGALDKMSTIQQSYILIYGSRCLSHNVHTVVNTSCKWHTMLARCVLFL